MEYKRSSHVEEEQEEEEEEEEEDEEEEEEEDEDEARGHRYTTAAAAPIGAAQQQQVQAQALGLGSHASLMDAAAFSRPRLPPNCSLVTQPPLPPPGFMPTQRQPQLHPRRAERERERAAGAPQPQPRRHQEGARNGVLGGGNVPPQASTLALATGAGAVGPVEAAQWRYRECLRNHAARLGAHVLDGCCEFMPSAGDGAAALACAACGCHRSFHRREAVPGVAAAAVAVSPSPTTPTASSSRVMPLLLAPPHMQTRPHVPVSPSSAPAALTESSSEELRGPVAAAAHPGPPTPLPPHAQLAVGGSASAPPAPSKKRFRTKFTADQKDRMREFAHRLGWRIHKPDSDAVDAFCAQVGVSRRVLKVWMHNNKHLAKIPPSPPSSQPPQQQPPHHRDHQPPPPPHHIHLHHPPPPPPQQQQQQHDA
ncbi:hypothetical protein PAHAL_1G365300 [Panicum hallii]|uniref:ZF-HD dimerization-type domain-containing protein n=1 Tax=Panicum hallii TaxID=206008 RepID=A0A2S3GSI0_9POAL|nr:zinc-finger homeodomain protein 7-like [Panicum hallii]PAN07818.1 hypothetical protein PAHAL_1G365300 [Panicum hallii]